MALARVLAQAAHLRLAALGAVAAQCAALVHQTVTKNVVEIAIAGQCGVAGVQRRGLGQIRARDVGGGLVSGARLARGEDEQTENERDRTHWRPPGRQSCEATLPQKTAEINPPLSLSSLPS